MYRLSARADPAFLAEMLHEAVNWNDDGTGPLPPLAATLAEPRNARYVDGWGRPGDVAVCALDRHNEPVGAAWYRSFPASAPGYGFVATDVPEVSIGVRPEFRGDGVGSLLLGALVVRAEHEGERALSLSVNPGNPARRLYERTGFQIVRTEPDALTMVLRVA